MSGHDALDGPLRGLVEELYSVDAADTRSALASAWRGFDAVAVTGRLLAGSHVDYAVLHRHARPVLARVDKVLYAAPSMTADLTPPLPGLADDGRAPLTEHVAAAVHHDVLDLAYALTILLPAVAGQARAVADRRACREAARLAHDLVNCYEGRLNLFHLPRGT